MKVCSLWKHLSISPTSQPPAAIMLSLVIQEFNFFRPHTQMRSYSICLTVSGLFHLAYCPPGSSTLFLLFSPFLYPFPFHSSPSQIFSVCVCACARTGTSVGPPLPLILWRFAGSPVSTTLLSLHLCRQPSNRSRQEAGPPGVLNQQSRKEIKATVLSKRKKPTQRQNPYLKG